MNLNETILKRLLVLILSGTALATYFFIILAQHVNRAYYWGLSIIPFLTCLALWVYMKMVYLKKIKAIKESWGKPQSRKRNFQDIQKLFDYLKQEYGESFFIDDQTWSDLNVNALYEKVDRTHTSPGSQMLYTMLRTPLLQEVTLIKRRNILCLFQQNETIREEIGLSLVDLGKQKEDIVTPLLWEKDLIDTPFKLAFTLLFLLAVISIVSVPFLGIGLAMLFMLGIFMINGIVYQKFKSMIQTTSIRYIAAMIKACKRIERIQEPSMQEHIAVIKQITPLLSTLLRKSSMIGLENFGTGQGLDALAAYINIFFLIDLRSFYRVLEEIKSHREDLKKLYLTLGEIDALLSFASYKAGLTSFAEPKFVHGMQKFDAQNLVHPLIDNPVANTVSLTEKGALITGSNMSGKSTFLRTVGINALLAQTFYTVLGDSYEASFFKVMTSISLVDNLSSGKSYYLGEAEALLRIIQAAEDTVPVLCIIDEIFRGTNSLERINAAIEILNYLICHNILTVVATHDLELTESSEGYNCYYFSENIGSEGLVFDYKLKQGVSPTRNALKLLHFLGYPKDIIEKATRRIESSTMDH